MTVPPRASIEVVMAPVPAPLLHLRRVHQRAAAREGVPTLLVLAWESEPAPPMPEPAVARGRALERVVGAFWTALAGGQRDDDVACVGSVLHAVADATAAGPPLADARAASLPQQRAHAAPAGSPAGA